MSRLCRLLCSLPALALSLLAFGERAHGGQVAPDVEPLVDVRHDGAVELPADLVGAGDEQTWVMSWEDLGAASEGTISSAPHVGAMAGTADVDPAKPAVIAAPLPPAIVSGIIGLVGVYAYKRRHRLR